jgi:hypothetical protein
MKIVLILVLLNMESGSEVITAEFDDVPACELAAQRTFQGIAAPVEILPLEVDGDAELVDGTMVAWGDQGQMLGMFSCSPSRSGQQG